MKNPLTTTSPFAGTSTRIRQLAVLCCTCLAAVFVSMVPAAAQSDGKIPVAGLVTDAANGNPLIGVTVRAKSRPGFGTGTDRNGRFILNVASDETLILSYIGYKETEVPVNNRTTLNIKLEPETEELEEVTIVGFGVQKKVSVIGSQQSIKATEIKNPVRNLTTSLGGRIAGLVSVQRKGEPGFDDATIYIRGISTLTASMSAPLTLVDGVPRSFSDVDPEDIESFTILKDASATAVYGVRGANGVILITTKGGTAGKPKFNIRYSEGLTQLTRLPEFANGPTYMRMANEAFLTRGGAFDQKPYSDDEIQWTADGTDPYMYPNVDWFDEIFKDFGRNRSANANISGGSESAIYYIGLGYYDEEGLYKNEGVQNYNADTYYRRYNVTSNITLKPTFTTEIKLGVQGYLANANYPGTATSTIFRNAFYMTPITIPTRYPDGKIADIEGHYSPYAALNHTGYISQWRSQVFSNLKITQQLPFITEGLSVSGMFSFDSYSYSSNRFIKNPKTWLASGYDDENNLTYRQTNSSDANIDELKYSHNQNGNRTIYLEAALNYARTFGRHSVGAMLLYNQSDEVRTENGQTLIEALPYRFRGLAGRATYSYGMRYFLEFNFGYNGAENFTPKNRYGFFPSVGVGWVVSEESFFEPVKRYIQFLKIRATYGSAGNSNLDGRRFAYMNTIASSSYKPYTFGEDMKQTYDKKYIDEYGVDVVWEESVKANIGLDLNTLNNNLNIQIDFFKDNRRNILLRRQSIPEYAGIIKNPFGNIGEVGNKGFDLSVNYNNSWQDWHLSLLGNFSFNRNKIIEDDKRYTYPWQSTIGQKVGQRIGYIALGLFESDEEVAMSAYQAGTTQAGDIKYKDMNGDGVIDDFDKVPIGWGSVPEIMYGFGFTVGYKNLSLSALFQGAANVDIMMSGEGFMPFIQGRGRGNLLSNIDDRWTEENPRQDAFYPRLAIGSVNMNYENSTWWLKNANYLRLKNLQISYNLPKKWMEKIHLKSGTVFIQGVNLLTFSDFKFWDVELGDGRGGAYPNLRSYSIGVNFSF